jgi:hypothetical protein
MGHTWMASSNYYWFSTFIGLNHFSFCFQVSHLMVTSCWILGADFAHLRVWWKQHEIKSSTWKVIPSEDVLNTGCIWLMLQVLFLQNSTLGPGPWVCLASAVPLEPCIQNFCMCFGCDMGVSLTLPGLTTIWRSFCLHLQSSWITGMCHYNWLILLLFFNI